MMTIYRAVKLLCGKYGNCARSRGVGSRAGHQQLAAAGAAGQGGAGCERASGRAGGVSGAGKLPNKAQNLSPSLPRVISVRYEI